jgi:hypothetical protein
MALADKTLSHLEVLIDLVAAFGEADSGQAV